MKLQAVTKLLKGQLPRFTEAGFVEKKKEPKMGYYGVVMKNERERVWEVMKGLWKREWGKCPKSPGWVGDCGFGPKLLAKPAFRTDWYYMMMHR